jgi:cystathionine gamma-synthase
MRIETVAVHAGAQVDPATGAVAPAIHPSTTFEREPDGSFPHGHIYTRTSAPNRGALETSLTALEGGAGAVAFASASAATSAVFQSLAPGDHVVAPVDAYFGTGKLLRDVYAGWGLEATFVDMTDLGAVTRAMRPNTKLVWAESPSNPLWKVSDLGRLHAIAHAAGARFVVDNTTATPILQSPFEHGADLVVHATTKYLGGHSDVVGGFAATDDDELAQRIGFLQNAAGAVPGPLDCYLVHRGAKTLQLRMARHSASALAVAEMLVEHPAVAAVHHPGLATHPGHAIAARQMSAFGGMVSFQLAAGEAAALEVCRRTEVFTLAESLGAVESLIEHPARMTHASVAGTGNEVPADLVRLSVGIEDVEDLLSDLRQALDALA